MSASQHIVVAQETCGLTGCEEPVGEGFIIVGTDGDDTYMTIEICAKHHAKLTEGVLEGLSVGWDRVSTPDGNVSYRPSYIGPVE